MYACQLVGITNNNNNKNNLISSLPKHVSQRDNAVAGLLKGTTRRARHYYGQQPRSEIFYETKASYSLMNFQPTSSQITCVIAARQGGSPLSEGGQLVHPHLIAERARKPASQTTLRSKLSFTLLVAYFLFSDRHKLHIWRCGNLQMFTRLPLKWCS